MNKTIKKYSTFIPITEHEKGLIDYVNKISSLLEEYIDYLPGKKCCRKKGRPKKSDYIRIKRRDILEADGYHLLQHAFSTTYTK